MLLTARGLASVLLLCGFLSFAGAQLSTSLLFQSGTVLQRQLEIPVWGNAGTGEKVILELNGFKDSTLAASDGSWEIILPARSAGGPYELTITSATDSLVYTDVYVGDVWLAAGQSNMAMTLKDCDNASEEIASADRQDIRQLLVAKSLGSYPKDELPAGSSWTPATPEYVGEFSGVAYYFAKYLHHYLDVPVGIINSSYGGTRIESWMSKEMLGYDEEDIRFGEGQSYLQPTLAYNFMLQPLLRFPIKGVIWYQGESNMGNRETALSYTSQFKKLISSWRELWGLGDIPFLWVQIPNTGSEASENAPATWDALPMLRESQSRSLSLPNTGEVVSIDTGEPDIHPTNKEPVGQRLSLVARSVAYGDSLVFSGPRYKSFRKLEDGKIEISFDHAESGLVALETGDLSLRWFSMAGSNGSYYRANAVVDSNRVVVWNPGIPNPEYIRYAYENNPYNVNFYNAEGLPASPFKLRVNHPGLHIQFFLSDDYALDKGESALLTWQVYGSDWAGLNHMEVDSLGGLRVWPDSDSTFTLCAESREHPGVKDSATIRIYVQEPDPTISLSADAGDYVALGTEVRIRAKVSAPDGGSISLVEFRVNGETIDSVSQPPYESTWIPVVPGTYDLTGKVSNHRGKSQVSDTIRIVADSFDILTFEAEDARIRGRYRIVEDAQVSNGFYADLTRDWTLSFDSIAVNQKGEYQLSISHLMNYGSPKVQDLYLNSELVQSISFESPQDTVWQRHYVMIPLEEGNNLLSIKSNWGLMSVDFFTLLVKPAGEAPTSNLTQGFGEEHLEVFPNPVSTSTLIRFYLPDPGPVLLDLYDLSGRKKRTVARQDFGPGIHEINFSPEGLPKGVYFLHFGYKGHKTVKKMLVL